MFTRTIRTDDTQSKPATVTSASEWSVDTLREFILATLTETDKRYEQRFGDIQTATDKAFDAQQTAMLSAFAAQKSAVDAALAAADRAVIKAETASEKRFDSVNEFRSTLADQQRTLMPRGEAEILIKGLSEKMESMQGLLLQARDKKAGMSELWGYIIGAAGVVGIVVAVTAHWK